MTDNLRIWKALEKTDPKHTKGFTRAGGFKGTALKPIWQIKRLTEHFGPAGIGWGMGMPGFETVAANDEILVFCTVQLWYRDGEERGIVYGVGGDKVLGKNRNGPFTNDEAFKASYTDALSNAMKQIGIGADVHMGLFDDEKYVRETAREFDEAFNADVERMAPSNALRDGDGKLLSAYDADKANRAKVWADSAIEILNLGMNAETARDWRREAQTVPKGKRKAPLDWLRENSPGQYMRVKMAYENAAGEELT